MNIDIDYKSNLPMYEQIEAAIKENILSGKLKYNAPLPSVRQLAKELNVSAITTKRAYMDLEHDNIVYTVSGKGTFINVSDASSLMKEKEKKLTEEFKDKVLELKKAGINKESLIDIIDNIYNNKT